MFWPWAFHHWMMSWDVKAGAWAADHVGRLIRHVEDTMFLQVKVLEEQQDRASGART